MSFDQIVTLMFAIMMVLCGTHCFFEDRGGWTLFWAEVKRKRRAKE